MSKRETLLDLISDLRRTTHELYGGPVANTVAPSLVSRDDIFLHRNEISIKMDVLSQIVTDHTERQKAGASSDIAALRRLFATVQVRAQKLRAVATQKAILAKVQNRILFQAERWSTHRKIHSSSTVSTITVDGCSVVATKYANMLLQLRNIAATLALELTSTVDDQLGRQTLELFATGDLNVFVISVEIDIRRFEVGITEVIFNVHADLMSAGEIWTDSEIDRDLLCLLSDGRYDELRLRLERLRRLELILDRWPALSLQRFLHTAHTTFTELVRIQLKSTVAAHSKSSEGNRNLSRALLLRVCHRIDGPSIEFFKPLLDVDLSVNSTTDSSLGHALESQSNFQLVLSVHPPIIMPRELSNQFDGSESAPGASDVEMCSGFSQERCQRTITTLRSQLLTEAAAVSRQDTAMTDAAVRPSPGRNLVTLFGQAYLFESRPLKHDSPEASKTRTKTPLENPEFSEPDGVLVSNIRIPIMHTELLLFCVPLLQHHCLWNHLFQSCFAVDRSVVESARSEGKVTDDAIEVDVGGDCPSLLLLLLSNPVNQEQNLEIRIELHSAGFMVRWDANTATALNCSEAYATELLLQSGSVALMLAFLFKR